MLIPAGRRFRNSGSASGPDGQNTKVPVAGILLTGGASRRMGRDKATITVDGIPLAVRVGRVLAAVADPALEVGPGRSGLPVIAEPRPGRGPLAAVAEAARALGERGQGGPALLVACDLPRLHAGMLQLLASWPGTGSAVPVVEGRRQYLCARLGAQALAAAPRLEAAGRRAVREIFPAGPVAYLGPEDWGAVAVAEDFTDVDEPADLLRAGLDAG